jgi:hypothetical protein
MKKTILLFISFIFLMNFTKAQNVAVGVHATATIASYKYSFESSTTTSKMKVGAGGGLVLSVPLGKHFSFRPELNYILKGGTEKDEDAKAKLTLNYLELPLHVVYNVNTTSGVFFAGAGPSFSLGVSGKSKYEDGETGDETEKINFGNTEDDDLKPLEIGVGVLAGYQFMNGFFVDARFNAGLTNSFPDDYDDAKFRNMYFGIGVGYMFNNARKKKKAEAD